MAAWRKAEREVIEDLETIVFHMIEGKRDVKKAKDYLILENRFNTLSHLGATEYHLDEAYELSKQVRGNFPGGIIHAEEGQIRKAVIRDIEFAIRRLQELKYEGSMIDAEALSRLERALARLGAGDGQRD